MRDPFIARAISLLNEDSPDGQRLDANETAFLERELTQLRTKVLEVKYPEMMARRFVPAATDIAPSAERYAYKVWDEVGQAKVAANASDDAPRVDVEATEITGRVYPITASYGWGLNEMREAARLRQPLSAKRAMAARRAIERGIDEMHFQGYTNDQSTNNLLTTGLMNNADLVGLGITGLTKWDFTTTVATILNDLNGLVGGIIEDSKQVWTPDTILLPPSRYKVIAQKMVGTDNDTTILMSFMKNNPFIKSIEQWWRLDGYGANSTGRALVYKKDPEVLEGVIPQEFEELAPQARNFEFVVNCQARAGGVKLYHPVACKYGDFAA